MHATSLAGSQSGSHAVCAVACSLSGLRRPIIAANLALTGSVGENKTARLNLPVNVSGNCAAREGPLSSPKKTRAVRGMNLNRAHSAARV